MKIQTIMGPYELIDGLWVSDRVLEGEVRMISGILSYAEDDIWYGIIDIVQHTKDRRISKWIPVKL